MSNDSSTTAVTTPTSPTTTTVSGYYNPAPLPKWAEGNVTLISSDKVSFKIHSWPRFYKEVRAANGKDSPTNSSDPNRKWPGPTTPASYSFTNDTIETAEVLGMFLMLTTSGRIVPFSPVAEGFKETELDIHIRLIKFLVKWACQRDLHVSCLTFRAMLGDGKLHPLTGFILGANADDVHTCVAALRAALPPASLNWTDRDVEGRESTANPTSTGPVYGLSMWNTAAMPLSIYRHIPPHYAWALGHAYALATHGYPIDVLFGGSVAAAKKMFEVA